MAAAGEPGAHVDEREQLEAWWETLDEERRRALVDDADSDPPGWAVASLVATVADREGATKAPGSPDAKGHLVQALVEFLQEKRAAPGR